MRHESGTFVKFTRAGAELFASMGSEGQNTIASKSLCFQVGLRYVETPAVS